MVITGGSELGRVPGSARRPGTPMGRAGPRLLSRPRSSLVPMSTAFVVATLSGRQAGLHAW